MKNPSNVGVPTIEGSIAVAAVSTAVFFFRGGLYGQKPYVDRENYSKEDIFVEKYKFAQTSFAAGSRNDYLGCFFTR
jgi:hypothetical protein